MKVGTVGHREPWRHPVPEQTMTEHGEERAEC